MTAIPAMGKVVTGDGQPYRYLVESIRRFPDPRAFARMIERRPASRGSAIATCPAASSPSIRAGGSEHTAMLTTFR